MTVFELSLLVERTISGSGQDGGGYTGDSLNLILIVAGAIGISFLAQYISRRRRK